MVDCESVWNLSYVCRNLFGRRAGFIGGADADEEREVDMRERVKMREDGKNGTYILGWSSSEKGRSGEIERCWRVWNIFFGCWMRTREAEQV